MAQNKRTEYKPYVPADKVAPELTVTSIVLGVLLAVVFGAANAYLGLRVGMTISASIPAAVLSMGVLRFLLRKNSILENNMVQTIGSAGESLAAGAIFTLPALFLWAEEGVVSTPSMKTITLICLVGGLLGVLFMIPLRQALIVEEHGVLPFPEGTACSEVLLAGEEGGSKAGVVFRGLGIAALYKLLTDGFKLWPSDVSRDLHVYKGSNAGIQVLPALAGVGYLCGTRISSLMFAGGFFSWFVLMPMIALFGAQDIVFPGTELISSMDPGNLWNVYVRYIGAGAVAAGGILSLIKSIPLITKTFRATVSGMGRNRNRTRVSVPRTEQDLPLPIVLPSILAIVLLIWLLPAFPVGLPGALLVVVFGFFFAAVSARMVGLIGSSNNPVSGMAIATLLATTLLLKVTGTTGTKGMIGSIAIGGIICVVAAMAGDTSQDLKTGFLVGATPKKQQIGELIGVVASALSIGSVLDLLNRAWGFGGAEIPAPQGMMMKMIVEGILQAKLPWGLILIGVSIAIFLEILHLPVMPVAVGMYLPFSLSAGILCGGLVRWFVEHRTKDNEAKNKEVVERGTLFTSGLIAGEGLMGILLAVFAVLHRDLDVSDHISLGATGALILWALLLLLLILVSFGKENRSLIWKRGKKHE